MNNAQFQSANKPEFLTIRQVAARGPLSEYSLRLLEKAGKLPSIKCGNRVLINYGKLLEELNSLGGGLA